MKDLILKTGIINSWKGVNGIFGLFLSFLVIFLSFIFIVSFSSILFEMLTGRFDFDGIVFGIFDTLGD